MGKNFSSSCKRSQDEREGEENEPSPLDPASYPSAWYIYRLAREYVDELTSFNSAKNLFARRRHCFMRENNTQSTHHDLARPCESECRFEEKEDEISSQGEAPDLSSRPRSRLPDLFPRSLRSETCTQQGRQDMRGMILDLEANELSSQDQRLDPSARPKYRLPDLFPKSLRRETQLGRQEMKGIPDLNKKTSAYYAVLKPPDSERSFEEKKADKLRSEDQTSDPSAVPGYRLPDLFPRSLRGETQRGRQEMQGMLDLNLDVLSSCNPIKDLFSRSGYSFTKEGSTASTTQSEKEDVESCAVVSSDGGTLKMNGVQLTWPPQAVDEPVTIKLALEEPSKYYGLIFRSGLENDLIFGASVINCQPNGQTFNKSLTLRITLNKDEEKFKNLFVLHGRKTESGDIVWEDISEKSTVDAKKRAVSTEINGFSLIAVLFGSIRVHSKELVTRLNLMSFKYTLSVLCKSDFQNCPFDQLALVFMSKDAYLEKHYREHDGSALTKLTNDGFEELGSLVRQETNYVYNEETLTVSIELGQDYKPANKQDESFEFTVESSVWWSTGHVIKLRLQSSSDCANAKIVCGKILVQGQYGHVREDQFCQLDLCGYVKRLLGVEKLISNLRPVAQELGLPTETWRQVVSCWKEEEKQLESILLHWKEKQGDDVDPKLLRKNLDELKPQAYRVKERGQMHITHLRELATTIGRLEHKDHDMMEHLSNEIKYLCGSIFRDCCIEMANSKRDLEWATSTENHSDVLVTHGRISQEVSRQYEEIRLSPLHSATDKFLAIVPHLIQPIKEIFKEETTPPLQNGMRGVTEETTLAKINSEIQDAMKKNNIFRLFIGVSNILECLCHSNNVDQSQITDDEIHEWGSSVMIIRMLKFLDKYFETAGSDALRLCERLRIFSTHLKGIMLDQKAYEGMFLRDFYNVALNLIAFSKFDPTRFLRFELKDPCGSADIRGDDVLMYDKSKEIFSQLFWIRKESEEELQLEAVARVHIKGDLRSVGAFESEITIPQACSEVIDKLSKPSLCVVVKRKYERNIRVTLYATQKENVCKALEYLKQELGEEPVDRWKEQIASSHLKLHSFAKAGAVVKLRLIHKWGSQTIGLDSTDFIALADASVGGARMPDAETEAEANQLTGLPTAGDSKTGSSDLSSFVMDPRPAELVQRDLREQQGKIEIHYHQNFMKGHVCVVGKNTSLNMQMQAAASDQRCLEAGPSDAP